MQITTAPGAWTFQDLQNDKVKAHGFIFASRCNVPWCYTIISFSGKETHFPHFLRTSVQLLSPVQLFATQWIAALQASLSITISRSSLKLMSIESVMPSSHLILCHPLFLLPPIPPSIRVFSNESTLHIRWNKIFFIYIKSPNRKRHGGEKYCFPGTGEREIGVTIGIWFIFRVMKEIGWWKYHKSSSTLWIN